MVFLVIEAKRNPLGTKLSREACKEDAPYLVESHRSSNLPAHFSRLQNANSGRAAAIPMRSNVIQSDPTATSLPRVLSL